MKKVLGIVLAAIVAVGVSAVFAGGDGCCMGKTPAKVSGECDMFSKLNLTDAQKTKLTTLKDRVSHATSTSEGKEMFEKGLAEILTSEQLAQSKAACEKEKAHSGSCPFMNKTDKKS